MIILNHGKPTIASIDGRGVGKSVKILIITGGWGFRKKPDEVMFMKFYEKHASFIRFPV